MFLVDMWSIGCIFAEFLGRKVFLPGQSGNYIIASNQKITFLGFEQLQLILQKIGTPDDDAIDRIPSEKVLFICYLIVIIWILVPCILEKITEIFKNKSLSKISKCKSFSHRSFGKNVAI